MITNGQFLSELAQGDVMVHRDPSAAGSALLRDGLASLKVGSVKGKPVYIYSITAAGRKEASDEAE